MKTENPMRADVRTMASGLAHRDAHPRKKRAASDNGVTVRTERRWGTPADAKGSPLERHNHYLEHAQDPWRILAHQQATVKQRQIRSLTRQQIIGRIRELNVENAIREGVDNANRSKRGVSPLQRAADHERDGASEIELAALWREVSVRGITEAEVFGS